VSPPLKILYLNVTQKTEQEVAAFVDMAHRYKLPETEVHIASLPVADGRFHNAEYRAYEAVMARGVVRAARVAAREGFDALAIGCFYDVALHDAREISGEMIVTAPCEASCEIAATLANRFGIIVGRRKWVHQMGSIVHSYGHERRLTGFYPVDLGVTDFQKNHAETSRRLIAAGRRAVEQDYAEALILGCTMEIGFYNEVEQELGVPVIDVAIAAMKRAEYGALLKRQCGWKPSRKWSCEPPPEQEIGRFGCFPDGETIGPRAIVKAASTSLDMAAHVGAVE
jgi:allantoin racemase